MRIPWEVRQARMAEMRRRELQPKEKPRFALRVARHLIGEDYDEEVLPAFMINFFAFLAIIAAPVWAAGWLAKRIGSWLKKIGLCVLIFCVGSVIALIERVRPDDSDNDWR